MPKGNLWNSSFFCGTTSHRRVVTQNELFVQFKHEVDLLKIQD